MSCAVSVSTMQVKKRFPGSELEPFGCEKILLSNISSLETSRKHPTAHTSSFRPESTHVSGIDLHKQQLRTKDHVMTRYVYNGICMHLYRCHISNRYNRWVERSIESREILLSWCRPFLFILFWLAVVLPVLVQQVQRAVRVSRSKFWHRRASFKDGWHEQRRHLWCNAILFIRRGGVTVGQHPRVKRVKAVLEALPRDTCQNPSAIAITKSSQ